MSEEPAGTAVADEAALVAALARGDREAPMAALYDRYGSALYGLGVRLLADRGMAEELVQETFIRLWRSAPSYDPAKGSVRGFTYTIARRVAIDLQRRRNARPVTVEENPLAGSVDERFDGVVLAIDVREALASLSDKHRAVLELQFDEDLGQPEVAERLEVPLGTVKTRTYYGLRALRGELEQRELLG